jgi:hypothetical protein
MKLVEGHTLAEVLSMRPGPAHDLPRFLTIFQQVCQAVADPAGRSCNHLRPGRLASQPIPRAGKQWSG